MPCIGPASVAVVGGGASGVLTAVHLARAAARAGAPLRVLLIEPGRLGRGIAYSTCDPRHQLNVPAAKMSAHPDRPDHFLQWLRRTADPAFPAGAFAARRQFGAYLEQCLDEAVRASGRVVVEHIQSRAIDARTEDHGLRIVLSDGSARIVDAAVLAGGYGAPSTAWAPAELAASPRFVSDPWGPARPAVPAGSAVVLVGAGLTMTDMALRWGREDVDLHVVSRHGLLPLPHASGVAPLPFAAPRGPLTVAELRRLVFERIRAAGGDWRAVIDGLRPVTNELWARLDENEQARFLASTARHWDRVRHRIDPAVHAWLSERRASGALTSHTGTIAAARDTAAGVEVTLSDGATITAAAVVNCTGASCRMRRSADPLIDHLVTSGLITPGPFDLGLASDADGRTHPSAPLWAVGPLRRGRLWESTAVPEIRTQAAEVAATVVRSLSADRVAA